MSAKHPPLDLLVRMGRSNLNVITTIACLTAALAAQRKDFTPPEIETIGGEPLTPEQKTSGLPADGPYQTAGHYGVVPWEDHSRAVTGTAGHDNGPFSVADPRVAITPGGIAEQPALPAADHRLVAVIRSLDGTWHRPFTTLELAALQGIVEPYEHLVLEGSSDSAWRERIGNAMPKHAATAIGGVIGRALLLAMTGETFVLSAEPIWVRPIVVAVTVDVPRLELP